MFHNAIPSISGCLRAAIIVLAVTMPIRSFAQSSDTQCNVQTAAVMQQSSENAVQNYLAKVRGAFQSVGLNPPSGMACLNRWTNLNFGALLAGNWGALIQSMLTSIINSQLNAITQAARNLSNQAMASVNDSLSNLTKGVTLPGGIGQIQPRVAMDANGNVNASIGYAGLGTSGNIAVNNPNPSTVPAVPSTEQQVSTLGNWFGKLQNAAGCIFGRCK
ncbi:hypothetical protein E3D40_13670 [Burkholderia cepacia]|uniref:hypothetical protein n=1 Tax=Burkholderia cepacia TaxID=292 RepID=UPI001067DDAB|nr:hypothetical protein [Burkholderia cepacia]TEV02208.1 hypothetical protein E3D40_13670 [Burkholderia cepacia]